MKVTKTKDKELAAEITNKLKENGGYCPCRTVQNPETKCMCAEFRAQIERGELGPCHCGLYEIIEDREDK